MSRPEYTTDLIINGKRISRILIDQHYKQNHPDISDSIILDLVAELNGKFFDIESTLGDFEYFRAEPVFLNEKPYRVVCILCIGDDFIGLINAFRVKDHS